MMNCAGLIAKSAKQNESCQLLPIYMYTWSCSLEWEK